MSGSTDKAMTISTYMVLHRQKSLPVFFHEQVATGEFSDGTPFRILRNLGPTDLVITTDCPHPDDQTDRAVYVLGLKALIVTALAEIEALHGMEARP